MAGGQGTPDPVEQLREQLRSLGYLDARVDRFVIGRKVSSSGTWWTLAASARIGMLAGALLGLAAAVGLSSRLPGLVTSLADAIVLAIYLGLLLGGGAAVLAFAAIIAAGTLARGASARPDFPKRARRAAFAA